MLDAPPSEDDSDVGHESDLLVTGPLRRERASGVYPEIVRGSATVIRCILKLISQDQLQ